MNRLGTQGTAPFPALSLFTQGDSGYLRQLHVPSPPLGRSFLVPSLHQPLPRAPSPFHLGTTAHLARFQGVALPCFLLSVVLLSSASALTLLDRHCLLLPWPNSERPRAPCFPLLAQSVCGHRWHESQTLLSTSKCGCQPSVRSREQGLRGSGRNHYFSFSFLFCVSKRIMIYKARKGRWGQISGDAEIKAEEIFDVQ